MVNMNAGGKNHRNFLMPDIFCMIMQPMMLLMKKQEKWNWKQAEGRGCLTRALIPGGVTPQSRFPVRTERCGEKESPGERFQLVGGEHKKYLDPAVAQRFALEHAKGIYENQRKDREDMRVLNLTRSGYASGQKYAAMLWSGDTCADWKNLKIQIVEGLNMGLSGYPYWTLDIGAFFHSCR